MNNNVSSVDQWIRILVGVIAAWEFMLQPEGRLWLVFFSAFFFFSGMLGSCPLYALIGAGTKRRAKAHDGGKPNARILERLTR